MGKWVGVWVEWAIAIAPNQGDRDRAEPGGLRLGRGIAIAPNQGD
ncbi:hypothetical protein [Phormidium sp. CCY1219]|nr:hypothetical protein [Phormidium sp. CCY1219]